MARFSHQIEYLLLVGFGAALRLLPRHIRSAIGACLGHIIYFIGIRKSVTYANLLAAYPSLPPRGIQKTLRKIYAHFGRVAAGFVGLPRLSRNDLGKWVFVEGFDVLDAVLKQKKGGIVVSGHIGNWEIMGCIAARCGYPVSFVVAAQSNPLVERLIDRYRGEAGVEIIKRRDAVRGVLSALKRNRLVAIMIDQDAHNDGVFVPFFGRPASTPRGPAVFHQRTGSPLLFAHSVRLPGERYRIRFEPISSDQSQDPDALTAQMTRMLENTIRETPEQWFWMHRRWKSAPNAS